jgi:hypothetical protein
MQLYKEEMQPMVIILSMPVQQNREEESQFLFAFTA